MLALAVTRAGTTEGAKVATALEQFKDVQRIAGPATFTSALHDAPNRRVAIIELTAGGAKLVDRVAAKRVPKYADIVGEK